MKKRTLEAFADQQAEAQHAENQGIARANRVLRGEVSALHEKLGAAEQEMAALQKELGLFARKYNERPAWLTAAPKKATVSRGTLVAFFSDAHYGEVVRPAELAGYNAYNLAIAEGRTGRFFERTVRLARTYFAGVTYDGIVLAVGGDLVSGDIHDELVETNETSTYETVLWAVPHLAAGVELLAREFGQVHVVSAPGNHGRDSQKPRSKGRSAHNADTLIMRLVARQLAGAKGVTFDIPESFDVAFQVYDYRFTMEHGDALNAFSGAPEIGSLGPVKRGTVRKKTQYAAEGKGFEYALWGHFHQYIPAASQEFIMNGSLKGYDEYARSRHLKPEPPQQALMLVVPEHGVTTQAPIFVQDRPAENW